MIFDAAVDRPQVGHRAVVDAFGASEVTQGASHSSVNEVAEFLSRLLQMNQGLRQRPLSWLLI